MRGLVYAEVLVLAASVVACASPEGKTIYKAE